MSGEAVGELVFMMIVLKLPVLYLAGVVYWAVRAEPRPAEPALRPVAPRGPRIDPLDVLAWQSRRRPGARRSPRPRPHGGPVRTYARREPTIRAEAD